MEQIILRSIGFLLNTGALISPSYIGKKGYKLFTSPQRLDIKPNQQAFFDSAENLDIPFDGETIRVYKWGTGDKKVLFCHGWQSHSFRWFPYVKALDHSEYTIYAMDGPASGQTTGNCLNVALYGLYVKKVCEELGPIDFYVGHSLGAFTILLYLSENNLTSVNGVICLACPGNAMDFVDEYVKRMNLGDKAVNAIIAEFVDRFNRSPDDYLAVDFVKDFEFPGLLIHDPEDGDAPYHYSVSLQKAWKDCELHTTAGLGHKLRSKLVVQKVKSFLDEVSVEQ